MTSSRPEPSSWTPDPATVASYEGSDLEVLLVLENYRRWILDEFRPYLKGRAAEIGAGIGTYSEKLRDAVSTLDLVEPAPAQHQALVRRFEGDARVTVLGETAEQWAQRVAPNSYDTLVLVNVLEHVLDDDALLRHIQRALRPGGHLLLFVPALMALYSRIDRLVGHHRRYHRHPLERQVQAAGLRIEISRYFDLLGTAPWFLINRLCGATRFNPGAARLYDMLGVPVTRQTERLFAPPFGKNVLLVAVKP